MRILASALLIPMLFLTSEARAFTLLKAGIHGWANRPLTFKWNPADCGVDSTFFESELKRALETWNSAPTSDLKLEYGGTTSTTLAQLRNRTATDAPVLVCNTAFVTDNPSMTGMTGIGYMVFKNGVGPAIDFGYVELNAQTGDKGHVSELVESQLALLLAHEIGHVLGLGHSNDASSIMSYGRKYWDEILLGSDDVHALSFLYPRDEMGGDGLYGCGTISSDDRPGGGGGHGGAAAAAELAMLLTMMGLPLALLRLRRT